MIKITDSAAEKIADIIYSEGNPNIKLRIFVQGGGCSGLQYGFVLDEITSEDDFEIKENDISILVDSISAQYLSGAVIDYTETLLDSQFKITNPNAQTTCGCGNSFSAGAPWDI